jgi:hypothetical protein
MVENGLICSGTSLKTLCRGQFSLAINCESVVSRWTIMSFSQIALEKPLLSCERSALISEQSAQLV